MDSSWEVSQGFPFHNGARVSGQHLQGSQPSASVDEQLPFLLLVRGTESFYAATFCSLSTSYEMSCAEFQYQAFDSENLGTLCEVSTEHLGSLVFAEYARSLGSRLRASQHSSSRWCRCKPMQPPITTWQAMKCSCTTGKGRRHTRPNILGIVGTARR